LSTPDAKITRVAAIILTAGDSERMDRPKALLPFRGTTFLSRIVQCYQRLACRQIIVVAGEHFAPIGALLRSSRATLIHNPDPDRGPLSSVQLALPVLSRDCAGFFIHPVDHPAVKPVTLRSMLEAWAGDPAMAVKPIYKDCGGHPMLLGRDWIGKLTQLPFTSSLRELLRQNGDKVLRLPVNDPGVLLNINEPADYARLFKEGHKQ